jgi:hypothetical protein
MEKDRGRRTFLFYRPRWPPEVWTYQQCAPGTAEWRQEDNPEISSWSAGEPAQEQTFIDCRPRTPCQCDPLDTSSLERLETPDTFKQACATQSLGEQILDPKTSPTRNSIQYAKPPAINLPKAPNHSDEGRCWHASFYSTRPRGRRRR